MGSEAGLLLGSRLLLFGLSLFIGKLKGNIVSILQGPSLFFDNPRLFVILSTPCRGCTASSTLGARRRTCGRPSATGGAIPGVLIWPWFKNIGILFLWIGAPPTHFSLWCTFLRWDIPWQLLVGVGMFSQSDSSSAGWIGGLGI